MVYITVKQNPACHQMTLEELFFGTDFSKFAAFDPDTTNTRTYTVEKPSDACLQKFDVNKLAVELSKFNASVEELRKRPRKELYREFYIPKKSGGLRKIDAPNQELMDALRRLKQIFETDFHTLYHTSAFAYIRGRSTIDAVKRHQQNKSRWFAKYDLSNFFGSTTIDFVMKMFAMVFPFSELCRTSTGEGLLRTAIELAFLDGGLPQGTPISPLITNVMMIPVDHKLANTLHSYNHQNYVYTRYADDFIISSEYDFDFRKIEGLIRQALADFDAPFTIKPEKTRYGSSAGKNWNLGVMLNEKNEITVGYKNKRRFQAMLSSYVMDRKNGVQWDLHDVQAMEGLRSYYRMVEGETIDKIVAHLSQKFGVDIVALIKRDLKA